MHLLNYVSNFADWLVDLFKVCWLAVFFLALAAPFFRRWRELTDFLPDAVHHLRRFRGRFSGAGRRGTNVERVAQEAGFRIHASHLIPATSPREFLSTCKLVDVRRGETAPSSRSVECDKGFRSTLWFRIIVASDPSGQICQAGNPADAAKRGGWRYCVSPMDHSSSMTDVAKHLFGNFYWILVPGPL